MIFDATYEKSILKADLKNTTDRRLLLGIIHRDNDLVPRKENKTQVQAAPVQEAQAFPSYTMPTDQH